MDQLALALFSIVIGVISTLLVSHYYFRRSVNKSLTPYVQFHSSLFSGVDTSVREALKIEYKGTSVEELYEIQFLIANTGERALRYIISPLTLAIPMLPFELEGKIDDIEKMQDDLKDRMIHRMGYSQDTKKEEGKGSALDMGQN